MTHRQIVVPKELLGYSDCYYSQRGKFDDIETSLQALAAEGCYTDIDRVAFMLIKPDAVISGKAAKLIQRLQQNGFRIVHGEIHNKKRERNFEELYKFNLTKHNAKNMLCAWWLARRVYTMGPSVDLLLSHENPSCRGRALYELLGEIKGVSNPYACEATSLRGSNRACNRSLNLVHASDSPLASIREFMIFRDVDSLIKGIRQATSSNVVDKIDSISKRLDRSLRWWSAGNKVSLSAAVATIQARLLVSCIWDPSDLPTVSRLLDLYNEIAMIDEEQCNPRIALNILRVKLEKVAGQIRLLGKSAYSEVTDSLMLLSTPNNYSHGVAEEVLAVANNRGVDIDPWDNLVLQTSFFHVKDFAAIATAKDNETDVHRTTEHVEQEAEA